MFLFSFGTILTFTGLIRQSCWGPGVICECQLIYVTAAFTVDLYLSQAASALAAQVSSRAIAACAFPLFSTQVCPGCA